MTSLFKSFGSSAGKYEIRRRSMVKCDSALSDDIDESPASTADMSLGDSRMETTRRFDGSVQPARKTSGCEASWVVPRPKNKWLITRSRRFLNLISNIRAVDVSGSDRDVPD